MDLQLLLLSFLLFPSERRTEKTFLSSCVFIFWFFFSSELQGGGGSLLSSKSLFFCITEVSKSAVGWCFSSGWGTCFAELSSSSSS